MNPSPIDSKSLRKIEKMISGQLSRAHQQDLREQLRVNPQLRRAYDLRIEALRELESRSVSMVEFDIVETWLLESENESFFSRIQLVDLRPFVFVIAVVGILFWFMPTHLFSLRPGEFRSKGSVDSIPSNQRTLAIDVLCNNGQEKNQFRSVNENTCPLRGVIAFAHRLNPEFPESLHHLSIFGIDEQGRVLYYRPTPVDPQTSAKDIGQWDNSNAQVELNVNHHSGEVQIYALASSESVTIEQIDSWATILFESPSPLDPFSSSSMSWIERIKDHAPHSIQVTCPNEYSCAAAQTHFTVTSRNSP